MQGPLRLGSLPSATHAQRRGARCWALFCGAFVQRSLPPALPPAQAYAVQYLHSLHLVHGDIKLANILLKTDAPRRLGLTPKARAARAPRRAPRARAPAPARGAPPSRAARAASARARRIEDSPFTHTP